MIRKKFLQLTTAGIGSSVVGGAMPISKINLSTPPPLKRSHDVAVVGAGAFGGWTAWHLANKGVVLLGVFSLIFLLAGFKRNHTSFIT